MAGPVRIVVRVEREHAGLIVVGRSGLGEAPRPVGSVGGRVLAHADIPVLMVPQR